jgi:hypothetical protein
MPWPVIGTPTPGIIVVYDLGSLPSHGLVRVMDRKSDQILYAHACPWTRDAAVAPDVATLVYESLVPPWGEKLLKRAGDDEVTRQAADARDPGVIAQEVLGKGGLDAEEAARDDLGGWNALVAATWPPGPEGRRSRLWAGGPVPSNRFG